LAETDFPPLIVEEAIQDEGAANRACYLRALTRYLHRTIDGRCYHVFVDVGRRFPSSGPFFPWPENGGDDSEPYGLRVGPKYRTALHRLLSDLIDLSGEHRVLVLCELNGNVTWPDPNPEEVAAEPVRVFGPMTLADFWRHHDAGDIVEPSLSIVQESPGD
jgi:hypothetical protein